MSITSGTPRASHSQGALADVDSVVMGVHRGRTPPIEGASPPAMGGKLRVQNRLVTTYPTKWCCVTVTSTPTCIKKRAEHTHGTLPHMRRTGVERLYVRPIPSAPRAWLRPNCELLSAPHALYPAPCAPPAWHHPSYPLQASVGKVWRWR